MTKILPQVVKGVKYIIPHRFPEGDYEDSWHNVFASTGQKIAGNYDYEDGGICSTPEDAEFIAKAREDVPYLLSIIEAQEGDLAYAEAVLADVREAFPNYFVGMVTLQAKKAKAEPVTQGEREMLHALIADFDAVTDPEEHPELDKRAQAVLVHCEEGCVPPPPPAPQTCGTWQPIETAPKDGSAVLVTDGATQRVAWNRDGSSSWVYYFTRAGAFATMLEPTHWMPLPDPPTAPATSHP